MKKYGQEKRRVWRKLHLAVDAGNHEVIYADLSLKNVTDAEAFPGLIGQAHRKVKSVSADGAYDTKLYHDELRRKKIKAFIPPRTRAGYWPAEYADRNLAVAETAMYRVKLLLCGHVTLLDYDAQVGEAMNACMDARKCANCLRKSVTGGTFI